MLSLSFKVRHPHNKIRKGVLPWNIIHEINCLKQARAIGNAPWARNCDTYLRNMHVKYHDDPFTFQPRKFKYRQKLVTWKHLSKDKSTWRYQYLVPGISKIPWWPPSPRTFIQVGPGIRRRSRQCTAAVRSRTALHLVPISCKLLNFHTLLPWTSLCVRKYENVDSRARSIID